ncbi:MAG: EamA family transporter [Spirochaetales bacterium]|nr:EamA family transporter [Spirochaetales bacterium]
MDSGTRGRIGIVTSMLIFGIIGLVRRGIPYSSAMVAFFRGAIAAVVLVVLRLFNRKGFDTKAIRRNLVPLLVSGAMIGFNWILLFEAYRYTTISVATICYYMSPIFTIIASPFTLKERLTAKKMVCVLIAMIGMVFVSGVIETGFSGAKGALLGLAAALLYSGDVTINKRMKGVEGIDRAIFQMIPAALAVLPYWLLTDNLKELTFDPVGVGLIVFAGVVATALCYSLYFSGIQVVPAQTAAILSYIDPVVAVLASAVILKEGMSLLTGIGVVMVIGAAMMSEVDIPLTEKGVER